MGEGIHQGEEYRLTLPKTHPGHAVLVFILAAQRTAVKFVALQSVKSGTKIN
jgi:hypothetical protein